MHYKITQASEKDWQLYKNIRLETLKKEPQAFSSTYENALTYPDSKWKELLNDTQSIYLLVFKDETAIGVGRITFYDPDEPNNVAVLGGIYINISHRKLGIGQKLVEHLITLAMQSETIKFIKLNVKSKQLAAINLYIKLGFEKVIEIEDEIIMKMKTIYFITGNSGKFEEVKKIIPEIQQLDIDLPEIQGLDTHEVLKEKLLVAQKHMDEAFIVEDTSFTLDGMNGLPGPLSKWFLKSIGNEGIVKLSKIFGTKAQAKSNIGYSNERKEIMFFEGVISGEIVEITGEASKGFGWDPIFRPDGFDKTFGEMEQDEKNKVSMRRIAAVKLKEALI